MNYDINIWLCQNRFNFNYIMANIEDEGKIWLKGSVKPEFGVRVGNLYFVIGNEDNKNISCLVYGKYLLVGFDNSLTQKKIFRRFSLDLKAKSVGTLFSGFKKTKHGDIKAVTHKDDGVETVIFEGKAYESENWDSIEPTKLMQFAGWK